MRINHKIAAVLIGAALLPVATWLPTGLLPSASAAGTITENMSVNATVPSNCNFPGGASTLAFGQYDPIGAQAVGGTNLTPTTTFQIRCTKGSSAALTMDNGLNYVSPNRNMKDAGTDLLAYQIYTSSALTQVWDNSPSGTVAYDATSSSPSAITVYGEALAGQDVPVGTYSDTVQITATY